MTKECKVGSAAYSRDLAAVMTGAPDGIDVGPTDAGICADALRYHANRRRDGLAVTFAIVATLGVGLPDLNGDGRVNLADLSAAARQALAWVATNDTASASERKS